MIWLYLLLVNVGGGIENLRYEVHSSYDECTSAGAKREREWKAQSVQARAGRQLLTVCLYNDPKSVGAQVRENPPARK